jgi:hypothetical protein
VIVHVADMGSWVMEMKKCFLSVLKTYMEVINLEQITSLFYFFDSCRSRRPGQGQDAILPIELHCCHVQNNIYVLLQGAEFELGTMLVQEQLFTSSLLPTP